MASKTVSAVHVTVNAAHKIENAAVRDMVSAAIIMSLIADTLNAAVNAR